MSVTGYMYSGKTGAENIRGLLLARFPNLKTIEMSGGYLLPDLSKRIQKLALVQRVKTAEEFRLYRQKITDKEFAKLKESLTENPEIQFCRSKATNIIINEVFEKKGPALRKLEPISVKPEEAKALLSESSSKPSDEPSDALSSEPVDDTWEEPDLADWENTELAK